MSAPGREIVAAVLIGGWLASVVYHAVRYRRLGPLFLVGLFVVLPLIILTVLLLHLR